jgi:two-component system, sporulation sensor kinase E
MKAKKNFLERFLERLDSIDSNSVQAYILRLSKDKGFLETVFNAINEGILVVDRHLKINYYNYAAKDLLGLPDDLENIRLSQLLHDVDWRRILQQDEEEWCRISRQEIEIIYPNHRFLQFYLVPMVEQGGYATVILRDVTESHERTIQELESEKVTAISMLAAGVAHEIGNPLNSLYLNLQLLVRMLEDKNTRNFNRKEAVAMVTAAKNEVERLDNIINQFLHAVRPGQSVMASLDMKNLIIDTLTFMRQEIELKSINVRCEWPDIDVICSYDEDWLELEFTDTGHGIAKENVGRIFEPFKSFKKGGTGIGMIIIERIMREHGAELQLQTAPGKGTCIVIRFPRHSRRIRALPEAVEK